MMREFVLPAEPRIARRLAHLAAVSGLQRCPETEALATEGLLDDDALSPLPSPLTGPQRQALQRILDQDLRALVLVDDIQDGIQAALAAAALSNALPIVVVVGRAYAAQRWERACAAHGWRVGVDPLDTSLDVLLVEPETVVNQRVMRDRRGGLLLIDDAEGRNQLSVLQTLTGPAREFPRTIALYDVGSLVRAHYGWSLSVDFSVCTALEVFFSRDTLKILGRGSETAAVLRAHGFTKLRPVDLYPLFGVVTDLLGDLGPK